jgi:hypothetical protein
MPIATVSITSGDVPADARDGLGRIGLSAAFDAIYNAANEFVQSEQAARMQQRFNHIGFRLTPIEQSAESDHNAAGLKAVELALNEVRSARSRLGPAVVQRLDQTISSAEGKQALALARSSFATELAQQDMTQVEFAEVLAEWDKHAQKVSSGAFSAVLDDLDGSLSQLRDARNSPTRGREPASPLPFWKILLVAVTIGIALGVVIACFVWFGCVWIMGFLAWYAPSLGWVIAMGC